jgi:hypothetical protein
MEIKPWNTGYIASQVVPNVAGKFYGIGLTRNEAIQRLLNNMNWEEYFALCEHVEELSKKFYGNLN